MSLEPYTGPACGNCGRHFQPGEVVCLSCGAHRYGDSAPVVGPLARHNTTQRLQAFTLWGIAGIGLALFVVLGVFAVLFFVFFR